MRWGANCARCGVRVIWARCADPRKRSLLRLPPRSSKTYRERLIKFLDTSAGLAQASRTTTADYADAVAAALAAKRPKTRHRVGVGS